MRNLIIIIDDMAISYCLYHNTRTKRNLMPIDTLKKAIRFAMMENFNLYIVYPVCLLPDEYLNVINSAHHYKIKSIRNF